jgi:3-hydroxybutyryl-CoA dehydrogenase
MSATNFNLSSVPVLVVGAGIMGAGIAQVAAQAGHPVMLFDVKAGAAAQALDKLATSLHTLAAKGKLKPEAVAATLARLRAVDTLAEAKDAGLVVEAILEKLDAKRSLFRELEGRVSPACVLATNTSSISVTAIANGLQHPERLVGMHFFNPVPLMKLVEVVSGLHTAPAVAEAIHALSGAWGKTAVHAKSTPGFIVNRIARPFYAETLALLAEQAGTPAELDACLRGAGFRMGPCELMDLIGHDTNFSVTQSVYEANFFDKRFVPSLVQRELVEGGLLGRKSGRGFYDYRAGASGSAVAPSPQPLSHEGRGASIDAQVEVTLHGRGAVAELLAERLRAVGQTFSTDRTTAWCGLVLRQASNVGVFGDAFPSPQPLSPDGRGALKAFLPLPLGERAGVRGQHASDDMTPTLRRASTCQVLRLTDGRPAAQVAMEEAMPDLALFDLPTAQAGANASLSQSPSPLVGEGLGRGGAPLAWTPAVSASPAWVAAAPQWLAALGFTPQRLADAPGLAVARTVAMLINEASDAVHQGVCSETGADTAMKLGVNYPAGPFEWLAHWGAAPVVRLLDALDAHYRGERYRVSPHLRQRVWQEGTLA